MDKTVVHPDNAILLSAKKNELSSHKNTCRNLKCILLSEGSQSEKPAYCIISTLRHSERAKLWRQERDLWVPGMGKDTQAEYRGFQDSDTTLYDAIMVDKCHCRFVQMHRVSNTKKEA